ncbi:MAG: hypothetical protein U0R78_16320 [Nocardioidaceae bacterium]
MKTRALAAAAAVLLTLSACGGGGDEGKAKEAIAKELMSSSSSDFSFEQKDADCVAEGMVDKIGVDQLVEYGILTDKMSADKVPSDVKMSDDDANAAADVFVECMDVSKVIKDAVGAGMTPEMSDCLDKALTDDVLHDFMVAAFKGDTGSDAMAGLTEPLTQCMLGAG